jgi:hypothetical protein
MNGGEEVNIMNYSEILFKGTKKHQKNNNKHIYYFYGRNNVILYASCVYVHICSLKENLYL